MVWLQIAALSLAASLGGNAAEAVGGKIVLLDFYADYCGPCRQMAPTLDELMVRGHSIRKINVEQNRDLAKRYGVTNIPCYVLTIEGREVDRVVGLASFGRLAGMFEQAKSQLASSKLAKSKHTRGKSNVGPLATAPSRRLENLSSIEGGSPIPAVSSQPLVPSRLVSLDQIDPVHAPQPNPVAPAVYENRPTPPAATATPVTKAQLLSCAARLRIEDPNGHSFGTGTIVDARDGCALILTCGHIFRDGKGKGRIEVDLFDRSGPHQIPGELVTYDLKRDLALVRIRPNSPVSVARVAPRSFALRKGMPVASVGCNHGDDPTVVPTKVLSLDKFLGPPNLQTAGKPVEGRSGGGLFTPEGYLVGVCNAADPADNEGFYAALASIHEELDRRGLSYIFQSPKGLWIAEISNPLQNRSIDLAASSMPREMPAPPAVETTDHNGSLLPTASRTPSPASVTPRTMPADSTLSPEERAALHEIERRRAAGTEVICIFRDRSDPQAKSEMVILSKASAAFLRRLADQSEKPLPSSR